MSIASEQIAKLESLLARIQRRIAEPRAPRTPSIAQKLVETHLVAAEPTPPFTPVLSPLPEPTTQAIVEPPPPVELELQPEAVAEAAPEPVAEVAPEPVEEVAPEPVEEEPVESISGEFAVAEAPMELEELGPASEFDNDPVVEIQLEPAHEDVAHLAPVVEDGRPALDIVGEQHVAEPEPEAHDEYEREQPPESGRELVASPHESQRVAVAAPVMPEEPSLELVEHQHELEPERAPESSRNLRAASVTESVPMESEPLELEPQLPPKLQSPLPEPPEVAAIEEEPPTQQFEIDRGEHVVEPAAEPHLVTAEPTPPEAEPVLAEPAIADVVAEPELPEAELAFSPPEAPAVEAAVAAPVEIPPAEIIRPQLVAADVAAYITAARAPRPETFGVLLDAALDL